MLGILYTLSHFLFKTIFEREEGRGGEERVVKEREEKLSNMAKVRLTDLGSWGGHGIKFV